MVGENIIYLSTDIFQFLDKVKKKILRLLSLIVREKSHDSYRRFLNNIIKYYFNF